MRFLKYLAAPALALSFVGLSPMAMDTARAAPAAGVLAVDPGDAKPAVENVHYRRWQHRRHYRPHYRSYGHRYYGRPYRYGHYRSYSPGLYLNIAPGVSFGHGRRYGGYSHW